MTLTPERARNLLTLLVAQFMSFLYVLTSLHSEIEVPVSNPDLRFQRKK